MISHHDIFQLNISIPGGKPLKIRLKARADVPNVIVEESEFAFGNVFVGATCRRPLTLTNTSMIPAMVVCDLSARPDFYLVMAANFHRSEEDTMSVASTETSKSVGLYTVVDVMSARKRNTIVSKTIPSTFLILFLRVF